MSKPESFRDICCCEYCAHLSWVTRKDAWCLKHEFCPNPQSEVVVLKICDDFEDEE